MKQDKKEKKEKKVFRIAVDRIRCKGCGICVALCPKQVLEIEAAEIKCRPARPEDCIGCLMCELHCPDFAILCHPAEPARAPETGDLAAEATSPGARGKGGTS